MSSDFSPDQKRYLEGFASGLAAARTLMAANRSVVVVEARDRIGGRVVTDSTTFGFPVDLGAAWLEAARTNPAVAILRSPSPQPAAFNELPRAAEPDAASA